MIPDQGPVVVIGLKEIYDALLRLDATVATLVTQGGETSRDLIDHEARLRSLEKGRWPLPSVAALVSIAALVVAVFLR